MEPRRAQHEDELRARFELERRGATRTAVLYGGVVAIVGLPLWSAFDYYLEPDLAWGFAVIRLAATLLVLCAWLLVFSPLGRSHPAWLGLAMLASVQIAIAAMIVQLDEHQAAYALGMSLAIYASAFLLVWSSRFTLALIGISIAALLVGWLLSGRAASVSELAAVAFYLLTASIVALTGQLLRNRSAWREFRTRAALEAEQLHSRRLVAELDRLSREDSLTGLANRRAWDESISRGCAQLARSTTASNLAVVLCDVDRLKEINDQFGHAMGDVVLREVGALLRSRVRAADLVARIGGDEFAILAFDADEVEAATLAEDIRRLVDAERIGGPGLVAITVSLGVAAWEGGDDSPEALMMRSDRRLYAAKATRNVVCAGDPVEPAAD